MSEYTMGDAIDRYRVAQEIMARLTAFVYAALLLTLVGRAIWIISAGTVYAGR